MDCSKVDINKRQKFAGNFIYKKSMAFMQQLKCNIVSRLIHNARESFCCLLSMPFFFSNLIALRHLQGADRSSLQKVWRRRERETQLCRVLWHDEPKENQPAKSQGAGLARRPRGLEQEIRIFLSTTSEIRHHHERCFQCYQQLCVKFQRCEGR